MGRRSLRRLLRNEGDGDVELLLRRGRICMMMGIGEALMALKDCARDSSEDTLY
jgi:hypothetical protein